MHEVQSPRTDDDGIERELSAKAKAPRVTLADIEGEIAKEHYFTAADGWRAARLERPVAEIVMPLPAGLQPLELLTFCVLVLRNGFTVTGESACASPENFDAEIGRKVARAKAVDKLWPLLGFRLRDRIARGEFEVHVVGEAIPIPAGSGIQPYQQRVIAEKADLVETHRKLFDFIYNNPTFLTLPPEEQDRLLGL